MLVREEPQWVDQRIGRGDTARTQQDDAEQGTEIAPRAECERRTTTRPDRSQLISRRDGDETGLRGDLN